MGQIEIIEKLDKELRRDIKEECQVVYILSRVRKILEIKNQNEKYKLLKFYCNWTLHSKLDRKSTTVLLKNLFEQDIDCKKVGKENARLLISKHSDFFKLSNLRQELGGFIKDNDLQFDWITKNWSPFIKILLEIIKECPIIFDSDKLRQLELIKDDNGDYCYKFSITGSRHKPIVKLKFK